MTISMIGIDHDRAPVDIRALSVSYTHLDVYKRQSEISESRDSGDRR